MKNRIILGGVSLILAITLLLLSIVVASAATYYVDGSHASASDTNPGTEASPWKTPYAWINVVAAGDTVYVKNGTYDITSGGAYYLPALNPTNEGTAAAPIAFRVFPGHAVIFNGGGTATIGSYVKNYLIWDGFDVRGFAALYGEGNRILQGIVLENVKIHGRRCGYSNNCDGIFIQAADDITVRNSEIYDIYNDDRGSNSSGLKTYWTTNINIHNNNIHDTVTALYLKCGFNNVT
ncbi:MAG: right-handed parallel beta-helix repeat-containing protein, partial [Nitrososphaera sp.]